MDSPVLDRAPRFKNNALRGGVLENVHVRNVTVGQGADAACALARAARPGYIVPAYRGRWRSAASTGYCRTWCARTGTARCRLINIVRVRGVCGNPRRDGSYACVRTPVVTDDYKSVGPFILAALELDR